MKLRAVKIRSGRVWEGKREQALKLELRCPQFPETGAGGNAGQKSQIMLFVLYLLPQIILQLSFCPVYPNKSFI